MKITFSPIKESLDGFEWEWKIRFDTKNLGDLACCESAVDAINTIGDFLRDNASEPHVKWALDKFNEELQTNIAIATQRYAEGVRWVRVKDPDYVGKSRGVVQEEVSLQEVGAWARVKKLEQALAEARTVIEFYGSAYTWKGLVCKKLGASLEADIPYGTGDEVWWMPGGKAREWLKRWGG